MVRWLVAPFVLVIFGLPLAVVVVPLVLWPDARLLAATAVAGPMIYSVLFVLTAGLLSIPFQKAIIPGKFPRDLLHPVYGKRRLYGLCWTCVFHNKPIYSICLSIPSLKTMMFRLFGYRGSMDFTVYADSLIGDLPLLDFGAGTDVADRVSLGTSVVLGNGDVLVDRIRLGRETLVGRSSMLGPGVVTGDRSQVGVGVALGRRVVLGDGCVVDSMCGLGDGSRIGARAVVGSMSCIGSEASVGPDLELPPASIVPAHAQVNNYCDVDALASSSSSDLVRMAEEILRIGAGLVPVDCDRSPAPHGGTEKLLFGDRVS